MNCLIVQDVMLLNQSGIFDGAAGMHDRYRDMRLDVDNMSYEVKALTSHTIFFDKTSLTPFGS